MARGAVILYLDEQIQPDNLPPDEPSANIQKLPPNRLINMDESAFFWMDLGLTTIAPQGLTLAGYKKLKNRTTFAEIIKTEGYKHWAKKMPRDLARVSDNMEIIFGLQHWKDTNTFRGFSKGQ